MFILYWPLVIIITIVLYGLILVSLPFSEVQATVFLFALISFWSRLPGVGMPSPFYVLYLIDFVDLFSLIIAINLGGYYGALFSVFGNLVSRACGIFPTWWPAVGKDTIAQFIVCLVIPYVHAITGGDILVSMIWYSIIRIALFFPMRFLPGTTQSSPEFLIMVAGTGGALLVINAAYARLFGDFLDNLLKAGVHFNWILFLLVTVVILGFKIYAFGHSETSRAFTFRAFKRIVRGVRKKVRQQSRDKQKEKARKDKRDQAEIDEFREIKRQI